MFRIPVTLLFITFTTSCFAQFNWKLAKDKDGIKVYMSESPNSNYKAIKVDCTLPGNYAKLVSIITNVSHHCDWMYNNKHSHIVQYYNPSDFVYYAETKAPWPFSNRDVVIRMRIQTDSLPGRLSINCIGEPDLLPEIMGKVRVPYYKADWIVTMPSPDKVHISYIMQCDPGGSVPSWIMNMFADKGPYGTFSKLSQQLQR